MNKKGKLIAKVKPQEEGGREEGPRGPGQWLGWRSSSRMSTRWAEGHRATLGLPNAWEGEGREKGTA